MENLPLKKGCECVMFIALVRFSNRPYNIQYSHQYANEANAIHVNKILTTRQHIHSCGWCVHRLLAQEEVNLNTYSESDIDFYVANGDI